MITQYQVQEYIRVAMPEINPNPQPVRFEMDLYPCLQTFTDYTKSAIRRHNFEIVRKCCEFAERLYVNGDKIVKNAVENTFVYSFSSFLSGTRTENLFIKSLIPASLYALYIRQLMQSGC